MLPQLKIKTEKPDLETNCANEHAVFTDTPKQLYTIAEEFCVENSTIKNELDTSLKETEELVSD